MDTTKWIGEEDPPMTTHAEGEEDPYGGYDAVEASAFGEF